METAMEAGVQDRSDTRATLLHVAWLAVALGLAMEIILLGVAAAFKNTPGGNSIIAELTGKISWSIIVCVGLAFGKAASQGHAAWTGIAGLLTAPTAFNVARSAQKSVAYALGAAGASAAASPFILASLKGLEYGILGVLLCWVGRQRWGGAAAHLGVGLAVGAIFSVVLLGIVQFYAAQPPPPPALISQGLNELLFPVGCSMAIFAAQMLGKKVS